METEVFEAPVVLSNGLRHLPIGFRLKKDMDDAITQKKPRNIANNRCDRYGLTRINPLEARGIVLGNAGVTKHVNSIGE
jgi:hypothetical protein